MEEQRSAQHTNTVSSDVCKDSPKQTGKGRDGSSMIPEVFETRDDEEEYKEVEE